MMNSFKEENDIKKWVLLLIILCFVSSAGSTASASIPNQTVSTEENNSFTSRNDETKTYRYRSGRRSYRPAPNYNAPVRTTPRYQAPVRRTGGFFGGIGSFFAGAFLGSMLFSPFLGGFGHFSILGFIIDVLMIYFIYKLVRKLFWRARH